MSAGVLHPPLVELLALGRRRRHRQQHLLLLLVRRVLRKLLHYVRPAWDDVQSECMGSSNSGLQFLNVPYRDLESNNVLSCVIGRPRL